jgi:hypothetical protein
MPLHLLAIGRRRNVMELAVVPPKSAVTKPNGSRRKPGVRGKQKTPTQNEIALPSTDQGPGGGLVRWVIHEGLAAAVVSAPAGSFQPLCQAAILTAIHRQIDILPVRFGTVLSDDDAVRSFLDRHGQTLRQALSRLQNTGEMGLRIELPRLPAPPDCGIVVDSGSAATSPAQYLARRRQQYEWQDRACRQSQQAVADHLQALGGLYRQWRRLTPAPPGLVRLAFLVERSCCGAFRERLTHWQTRQRDARCTLLGPWPPYSFV